MDRVILHSDINNFFASVEILLHPELAGKCIAVAGDPEKRHGIVLAKSNEAKAYGVKTAEPLWQAKQKCPDIIFVPPTYKKYSEYSKIVFEIYTRYTDLVESFGLDECWLDTTSSTQLFGDGMAVADRLRADIRKETGLSVSIGVSFNKIFAKLGSDIKKPNAVTEISKSNFKDIVWKQPCRSLIYIGKQTAATLAEYNIHTIGDLARLDVSVLQRLFGKMGSKFYEYAWGLDSEPVKRYDHIQLPDSVGNGTTTPADVTSLQDATRVIYALSEVIAYRLRQMGLVSSGIAVNLRDTRLKTISRQAATSIPVSTTSDIASKAIELVERHYKFGSMLPLRSITVSTYALSRQDDARQLSMFGIDNTVEVALEEKIDKLRDKYGYNVIQRALNIDTPYSCDGKEVDDDFIPFGGNRHPQKEQL